MQTSSTAPSRRSASDARDRAVWTIAGWNVNGIRSVLRKGALQPFLSATAPDIVCWTETKLSGGTQEEVDRDVAIAFPAYPYRAYNVSVRPGYSGTAIWSRHPPLRVMHNMSAIVRAMPPPLDDELEREGRVLTAEFAPFYVVCVYTPNAGQTLQRLALRTQAWDPVFCEFIQTLQRHKPVVIMGDLNCAHTAHDIHDPCRNARVAGYTQEERAGFETLLRSAQLVDSYRALHPHARACYTYWSYRSRARAANRGWRIDYGLLSAALRPHLQHAAIHGDQMGSDHCPVSMRIQMLPPPTSGE